MNKNKLKRYAFIDVQNTEGTVKQMLDFTIDWNKLYSHLKVRWNCENVFFYSGIEQENKQKQDEYSELEQLGYQMRVKPYKIYKNPDKTIKIICPVCLKEISHKLTGTTRWKSNCDSELSVDAINLSNLSENPSEFLIFTGDGDFEYLIRDLILKETKVYLVSSGKKIKTAERHSISRFSTKLRELMSEKKNSVFFIDIDGWKKKIEKDTKPKDGQFEQKENATQVGVF